MGTTARTYVHAIEVRFRDLDSLGHINNAVYLSYVEQARIQWFRETGLCAPDSLHAIPFILARAEIDFIRPGKISEALEVKTWIAHLGTKSFTMAYEITSQGKDVIARSQAVLVWYDYSLNKSVAIPADARTVISRYLHT